MTNRKKPVPPPPQPVLGFASRMAKDALQHGADEIESKPNDDFEKTFLDVAGLWDAYLTARLSINPGITGTDVAKMMLLVDLGCSIGSDTPEDMRGLVQSAGQVVGMAAAEKHGE